MSHVLEVGKADRVPQQMLQKRVVQEGRHELAVEDRLSKEATDDAVPESGE